MKKTQNSDVLPRTDLAELIKRRTNILRKAVGSGTLSQKQTSANPLEEGCTCTGLDFAQTKCSER